MTSAIEDMIELRILMREMEDLFNKKYNLREIHRREEKRRRRYARLTQTTPEHVS